MSAASMFGNDHSLMLQVSSLTPEKAVQIMDAVRQNRITTPRGQGRIMNLVLDQIASHSGEINWPTLDALAPYFPGGVKSACDNAFVGGGIIPFTGTGSPYREGAKSIAWRTQLAERNRVIAEAFVARYPNLDHHWYISQEAVLEWWAWDSALRAGFATLLADHLRIFERVKPGKAVMWSPAFWERVPPSGIGTHVGAVLKSAKSQAPGSRGIGWLHLQDMQGREWQGTTYADTRNWMNALKAGHTYDSLRVNLELFEMPDMRTSERSELAARVTAYTSWGLPLGACFEGRYWFDLFGTTAITPAPNPNPTPVTPTPSHASSTVVQVGGDSPYFGALQSIIEAATDKGETLQNVVLIGVHS